MKNLLLTAALFSSFSVLAQNNITSIEVGTTIPMADAKMKSTDGKTISLDKAKTNNGLLVMFSCNTCPYVIKSEGRTKEMMDYAMSKQIGMVIINSNEAKRGDEDSDKAMAKYAKKMGYKVPYVIDEKSAVADAFGATRTPEVFLFDGNGKLMYKGAMEDNPSNPSESKNMFLKDAIDKIVAGQVPDPNSTKSIGCTIKRM
ncbi:MAG: thioredoxin family protein [Flavipsychrobacter sp.]|nr:thioredoxin family protein [Flavipsychrobacter sp.]